jgi:hypothetical protein
MDEFFAGVEKSIPNYHQSITNLQQEWLQTCENTIKSMISVQQEFVNKAGINAAVPETILMAIRNTNEEILKVYSIQTQVTLATIDASRENIKTFNDNAKFFADMSKNVAQYWISVFTPARN